MRHAFLATKICTEQHRVGIDNRYQADRWEMVAFGQHLGSQQYSRLAPVYLADQLPHSVPGLHGVAVNAEHWPLGKSLMQKSLGLLSAQPRSHQSSAVALGALARQGRRGTAMVAAQSGSAPVYG